MATGVWRGVNNIARKVKKQWRGVSNVTREIKKEWRGVGNVARLVFRGSVVSSVTYDSGLTVAYESSYYGTGIYVYTESSSTKYVYIYGDFAGKTITGAGRRDTKARGWIELMSSSGSSLASKTLKDEPLVNNPNFSFGPYSDAVALRIGVYNNGADCVAIYELKVDGENILDDIQSLLS